MVDSENSDRIDISRKDRVAPYREGENLPPSLPPSLPLEPCAIYFLCFVVRVNQLMLIQHASKQDTS
eukprot:759988-Hanusia_phi.AAC.2